MISLVPTAIERVDTGDPAVCLLVKRDDRSAAPYGGNKARKLARILVDARAAGARRLVTIGPAGSHHVLATTVHGRRAGLEVAAVLVPQPRTDHAVDNLRAGLAQGLEAHAARHAALVPLHVLRLLGASTRFVTAGGSSVPGSAGYVDGARELAAQLAASGAPAPDEVVVALGSGGTAAGLLVGLAEARLPTRVVAVRVVPAPFGSRISVLALALRLARRLGIRTSWRELAGRLVVDASWLGPGYGVPSGREGPAHAVAAAHGLALDPAYTAKTLAAALDRASRAPGLRVLYWHTLSSAPMAPLLVDSPSEDELPAALRALFR